jgi:hypothetical protein
MHYSNGREARNGDFVIAKNYGHVVAGVIHSLNPACETCNGTVCWPVMGGVNSTSVNVKDCVHAEDALAAVTPDEAKKP